MEKLHFFSEDISGIEKPQKFNFPFYYTPHPLSVKAANQVQKYLETQTDFSHEFGLSKEKTKQAIGKMFGVLVVETSTGELGYLAAFSGKLANANRHDYFVPPVFDLLSTNSFFLEEEKELNALNRDLENLLQEGEYLQLIEKMKATDIEASQDIERQKKRIKEAKIERDFKRKESSSLSENEKNQLEEALREESKKESILLKKMNKYWRYKKEEVHKELAVFSDKINQIKQQRSEQSAQLQQKIFDHYTFLNARKENKSLLRIFGENPPAGAGECAAPKLLQYAYENQLTPLCLAEFWWGASPPSEVRKHKNFYPSCRSKCEPILGHMLQGLEVEDNPLEDNPAKNKEIELVYEDEDIAVIFKPVEFLSVPGKQIKDSVFSRVQKLFPEATGPLVVHRLDMSTSGLMLIAKNEAAYVGLQAQFIQRKVYKRYEALLEGKIKNEKGKIELPLRVDLDNRPHQLVCYEHGKPAVTHWEKIGEEGNVTRVYFYPITGRTHQLRVHAAHHLGLNTPIVGDDLYGKASKRLCLHAGLLKFIHPKTKKEMSISKEAEF